jgi:hypothetical protein
MPNQIHVVEGHDTQKIHLLREGDLLVSSEAGGYSIYRWRANKNPAILGFVQEYDEALALAKRKQEKRV